MPHCAPESGAAKRAPVDGARRAPYSDGMIPDFQELSDKIDQLAELTHALRRENAQLRQANSALVVENMGYQRKLGEASARVAALLEQIPALEEEIDPEQLSASEEA